MVLKPSSRSRVDRRKMFVRDNRHTIKIQHVSVLIKDGLLEERGGEGGLFKLYRADVELSCPRTPAPTSDGQWEECPAAGSIMHLQHLKTMSVRSNTPSPKNGWLRTQILQRPSSIDFICCIPHQYLCCHPRIISFQIPMLRSFIWLTLIFIFLSIRFTIIK